MKLSVFKITKMDCPSEERIIRMKLAELPIKHLEFDIPGRKMMALHEMDEQVILDQLVPLNFGTSLETTSTADQEIPVEDAKAERKVLRILLAINAFMFLVELVTGLLAESMGLISDSFDMFADASVYLISLYAVGKSLILKQYSARLNGYFQMFLAAGILLETVRRFIYGSEPDPDYMIIVSLVALAANVYCLLLLSGHKEKGVHMQASYICSSTDVLANAGVILAGILVMVTGSALPDLVVGLVVVSFVTRGAFAILKLAK